MGLPTILDVARRAQVSAGTVSRVLGAHPTVSPENHRRVQEAISFLNYSPRQQKVSRAQANPLEKRSIVLLTVGMDPSLRSLPCQVAAMEGAVQGLTAANANLLLANIQNPDHVHVVLRRSGIDGVIAAGALQGELHQATCQELLQRLAGLPIVWIIGRPVGFGGDAVQPNDFLIGKIAAEYLVRRGHTSLAFVSPKPSQAALLRRQASFSLFARRAGAKVKEYLGADSLWNFPSHAVDHRSNVQGLVDRLLRERTRPSAIFAPDDSVGALVARELAARDCQVGRDISLMSCNNEAALLMGIHPKMTTIEVHAHTVGTRAVDQLAWRLRHLNQPPMEICVEPDLVEGASVLTHESG